jgi:hypothetical protein
VAFLLTPSPAAPPRPRYVRTSWERVLLNSGANHDHRIVGLVLAHLADAQGELPAGGPHSSAHLAHLSRLQKQRVRASLEALEDRGFMTRPDLGTWTQNPQRNSLVRPITLTLPAAARRTEPAHTSGAPE